MSSQAQCAAISAILLCVLLALTGILFRSPREFTMTRTVHGWVPQTLIINKGDTIAFKADTAQEFWPASDSHPTHLIYPEFDPKKPIPSTEEWKFTFTRAGVWSMHDHMASEFKGTIIVQGLPGEAQRECLSRAEKGALSPSCWVADIEEALKTRGLGGAYDLFDSLYTNDPAFQRNCHDVSHVLGTEAYKLFSNNHHVIDRPETAYCGYGFYHGFIEAMLVDRGPSHYGDVRAYCETLRKTSGDAVAGPCFHGIGHAVFDSLGSELWGNAQKMMQAGLDVCESVLTNEADRVRCATGVFNSLHNALGDKKYRLSHEKVNEVALCQEQRKVYQEGCIIQAGTDYMHYQKVGDHAVITFTTPLARSLIPTAIFAYFDNTVIANIASFKSAEYRDMCISLKDPDYTRFCIRGVIAGINNLGDPLTEYVPMFEFCDAFSNGVARSDCFSFALDIVRPLNKHSQAFDAACRAITGVPNLSRLCDITSSSNNP